MDLTPFLNQFREETVEHVRALTAGLLAIEAASDDLVRRQQLDRIFRAMHSVKGTARMLGFEPIGRLAHRMESLLGELRAGRRTLDRSLADALLSGGDTLVALATAAGEGQPLLVDQQAELAGLELAPTAPPGALPAEPAPPSVPTPRMRVQQTIRVRVDRLDRMLNLAGELAVAHQRISLHAVQLRGLQELAQQHQQTLLTLERTLERLSLADSQRQALAQWLDTLREQTSTMRTSAQTQAEQFERHSASNSLLIKDVEQEVLAARLLPVATVYNALPRAVRDLAQATGKEVRLELVGENVELDRRVLELVEAPLLQLVRNAVDHGLEDPDERARTGKHTQGLVEVRAETVGGEVRLVVADDGRGMEPQHLRKRAIELGLLDAEAAAQIDDAEALELIFLPGFTTAATLTEISGRGVGLDVVRANVAECGGQLRVEALPKSGTRIILTLPLTLATTRVLMVRVERQLLALPASACRGVTWVRRAELQNLEGYPTIEREGASLVVVSLAERLGIAERAPFQRGGRVPAVLVGSAERPLALLVDALLDECEVVVKPLGPLLGRQRWYGGAIQLGNGELVLLVNPALLAHSSHTARPILEPTTKTNVRPRLLVVDDSFTTRELIRSMLVAAGYEVEAAVDGVDGLEKLRGAAFDLVVSDIEMPRMDGFQLAASVKNGEAGLALPVLLVSSLASDEDRRRGLAAGASAYLVKSQFSQESLLDVVTQLLEKSR